MKLNIHNIQIETEAVTVKSQSVRASIKRREAKGFILADKKVLSDGTVYLRFERRSRPVFDITP